MNINESSDSNAISWSRLYPNTLPICYCGKKTKVSKSWTNENLGRRFVRCEVHGFVRWYDEEKPHGWHKLMLLEARDEICNLKEIIRAFNHEGHIGCSSKVMENNEMNKLETQEKEIAKLKENVTVGKEREKMLRQFIVISWCGFMALTAMTIMMLK